MILAGVASNLQMPKARKPATSWKSGADGTQDEERCWVPLAIIVIRFKVPRTIRRDLWAQDCSGLQIDAWTWEGDRGEFLIWRWSIGPGRADQVVVCRCSVRMPRQRLLQAENTSGTFPCRRQKVPNKSFGVLLKTMVLFGFKLRARCC